MKKWVIALICALIAAVIAVSGLGVYFVLSAEIAEADTVYINRVMKSLEQDGGDGITDIIYPFVVVDDGGKVIFNRGADGTPMGYNERIAAAEKNHDIIKRVNTGLYSGGTVIFHIDLLNSYDSSRKSIAVGILGVGGAMIIILVAYLIVIIVKVLSPFRKLSEFATEVARGNLDLPLDMDRNNSFGDFQEAFDIMRVGLKEAKLREQRAYVREKEIIAEISHDIKNPIASIKATAELALVKTGEEWCRNIIGKANEINVMMNEIYSTQLNELNELQVNAGVRSSKVVEQIIREADYNKRTKAAEAPDVKIWCDLFRLLQVFENVIGNSYKYADTDIAVSYSLTDDYLIVSVRDYGAGVNEEELAFVNNKFFRGERAYAASGEGLGLYVSSKIMDGMQGKFRCYNDGGFVVEIGIRRCYGEVDG